MGDVLVRVLCKVAYDGSNYFGFQKQNNCKTIQSTIEECLKKINKKEVNIYASGRTDAKVHAYGQMFHFNTDLNMNEKNWYNALNSLLPNDIRIVNIWFVEEDFHARYNAKMKNYIYKINMGKYNLFEKDYITQINKKVDIKKLKKASNLLIGTHDFRNFCANNEIDADYIRTIFSIDITKNNKYLELSFLGTGFKKYMIRMIVGTLIAYADGKIKLKYIKDRLDKNTFNTTHYNALPEGLYLNKVYYERSEIDEG